MAEALALAEEFARKRQLEDEQRDRNDTSSGEADIAERTFANASRQVGIDSTSGTQKNGAIGQIEKVVKTSQWVLRALEGLGIVSIVGIIPVAIRKHYQLVFGNLLGGAILPAPKLAWWEIALLCALDIFIAVVIGAIIVIVYYLLNPLEVLKEIPQTLNPFNGAGGVVNDQVIAPRAWR